MQDKSYILLVGNNPDNLPDLEKVADQLGHAYLQCATIAEVSEVIADKWIVLLVSDPSTLGETSMDFIISFRTLQDTRETPILLLNCGPGEMPPFDAGEAPIECVVESVGLNLMLSRARILAEWCMQGSRLAELEAENERLDHLNRQVRKFVGNVAHDLRGPLGKLINTAEVLMSGVDPDSVETFYRIMAQTSRRGFDLVNDILDITALESGHVKLCFEKMDVASLVDQVLAELNYLGAAKDLSLVNELSGEYPVYADRRRLFQVFGNLINNAIKFTPRSGRVTVVQERVGSQLRIKICDSGVGIEPAKVRELFNKSAKNSTLGTEGEQGTGFGLPLAQEIIRGHDSEIKVTSKVGEGSCFSFELSLWDGSKHKG